jgi:cyclic pyranopterin phosphate synthase
MPSEGESWLSSKLLLSNEELLRLVRIAVDRLGIDRVRLTGGEPLMRPDLDQIIFGIAQLRTSDGAIPEISLTTNGIGLDKRIGRLVAAGLQRVNVSLDAVDPRVYTEMTRRRGQEGVLRGLAAVQRAGLHTVKVNAVVLRGINESEILPLAHFCLERGLVLRFIEEMPLGPVASWTRDGMVSAGEILEVLRTHFELGPTSNRGAAPAEEWLVKGSACHCAGRIGVIASVTMPFCAHCDRTRLTADGQLRTCLLGGTEVDLRGAIRAGASDSDLAELWATAHAQKKAGHGIGQVGFDRPLRNMSQIGG